MAAAGSVLRSATTFPRSSTARLSATVNSSPFCFSYQKALSTHIFRSPMEMNSAIIASILSSVAGKVDQRKNVACFSSLSKRSHRFRFQRRIDLKRSTPSMGILERVEYDPNRTSRIGLIRWKGGAYHRGCDVTEESFLLPDRRLEATTTTIHGKFALSSMPGEMDQSKQTNVKDIFLSALSSEKVKGETTFGSSSVFPSIGVAGAKPAFFAVGPRGKVKDESTLPLSEIRKWKPGSTLWKNRIKRKGAVSWQSFRREEILEPIGASEHNKSKLKMDQGSYTKAKNGRCRVGRAPVSYIIASHQLQSGMMVMNH